MTELPSQRRYELDWLRVIAFSLLIYFHAAIAFVPNGLPLIQNTDVSPVLNAFVAFLQEFRLGLLFLISGCGVYFATGRGSRSPQAFFRERSMRLLIPLLVGVLVVVPPMVHVEKLHLGSSGDSFVSFYANLLGGIYPKGNLSWHHYWFVAYLFIFCVIGWPIYSWINSVKGVRLAKFLAQGWNLAYVAAPLLLAELVLRPLFPGFRDLIHDWASFTHWLLLFLVGFLLARHAELLDRCMQVRGAALAIGVLASGLMFVFFYGPTVAWFTPIEDGQVTVAEFIAYAVVKVINAWGWLVACIGFAVRYLQRSSRLLAYLNQAVYPVFCVHLSITVFVSYWVVEWPWSIAAKYILITSATIAISLGLYEFLIRRSAVLRVAFGVKPG